MQSMPLLFRQSFRSSLTLTRTSRPIRPQFPASKPLQNTRDSRPFSICLQCQFRARPTLYSNDPNRPKDEKTEKLEHPEPPTNPTPQDQSEPRSPESENVQRAVQQEHAAAEELGQKQKQAQTHEPIETKGQRLPSSMESRRSQWSKQFSSMMDNLQSNVFVAGQRLNDLTGYSSIEALKKEIHSQEERLRLARSLVRETKNNYTAAINRRSTSQREVNELLQRKHAWSSADLERFTHLYRNDHANEVAENEAQEAYSRAEREAEEASAYLSKSILSRYHEEQIWSDKIRRMSTWGTWGLMGVNVLLFLIFQIAVEPWRRKRLVKGFEEKVLEALEKDKALEAGAEVDADPSKGDVESVAISESAVGSDAILESSESIPVANESSTTDSPALQSSPAAETEPSTSALVVDSTKPQLSRFSSLPPASVESWRNAINDLFSDRSFAITQRDLTTVAIQSAAAGAAVMGLVIALIRPR